MRYPWLMLALAAVLVGSVGMALRGTPSAVVQPAAYVETGSLRLALAWREAVRMHLRRVGSSMLRPPG
jgi:hypothetical protein